MATYTSNYGLHQWAPEDNFLRTDFNEDLKKIDTALGQKASTGSVSSLSSSISSLQSQINSLDSDKVEVSTTGRYVGDDRIQIFSMGYQPKAVIVSGGSYCGIATTTASIAASYVTLRSDGFSVQYSSTTAGNANNSGITYQYMVLR